MNASLFFILVALVFCAGTLRRFERQLIAIISAVLSLIFFLGHITVEMFTK